MFKLNIPLNSLEKNKSGKVTGIICVRIDKFEFPEADWNDFVVIILNWWFDNINQLATNSTKEVTFRFMDGPLEFKAQRNKSNIDMSFFYANSLLNTASVNFNLFVKEIISTTQGVIKKCEREHWVSDELDQLMSLVSSVKGYTKLNI